MTLIEEKCRFLSNFSLQTAEVELPGEFLLPKHSHYYVRIARFMPKVEVVHKLNTACRRLYIRGHNGKVLSLPFSVSFPFQLFPYVSPQFQSLFSHYVCIQLL